MRLPVWIPYEGNLATSVKIDVSACEFIFLEEKGPDSRHRSIWLRKGHRITLLPGGVLSLVPGEREADEMGGP